MRHTKIVLLACLAALAQPVVAATVVTVNGVARDSAQADIVRADLQQRKRPASDENVRNFLIDNELMAQEAVRRGLDRKPDVQAILELQRKDVLGKMLIEQYITEHPVDDARTRAEYDALKARSDTTEYLARHILVDDEAKAKALIARLGGKKPAKFEDLAKKESKDPGSAKQGGELGWMSPSNLVPEFSTAMKQLKKGEYTRTPVKTQFGWHVIKLENSRPVTFPEFDKVKGRIGNQLVQQDLRKYLNELRATAKIDIPGK